MKKIALVVTLLTVTGCGSYAQFSGKAPPQEYVMCSNSTGGGALGALTGTSDVIKITTQGDMDNIVATCKKGDNVLTVNNGVNKDE